MRIPLPRSIIASRLACAEARVAVHGAARAGSGGEGILSHEVLGGRVFPSNGMCAVSSAASRKDKDSASHNTPHAHCGRSARPDGVDRRRSVSAL